MNKDFISKQLAEQLAREFDNRSNEYETLSGEKVAELLTKLLVSGPSVYCKTPSWYTDSFRVFLYEDEACYEIRYMYEQVFAIIGRDINHTDKVVSYYSEYPVSEFIKQECQKILSKLIDLYPETAEAMKTGQYEQWLNEEMCRLLDNE